MRLLRPSQSPRIVSPLPLPFISTPPTASLCLLSLARQVSCPSGVGCLYAASLCNNHKDCLDGSDEGLAFCSSFNCSSVYTVRGWLPFTGCLGGTGAMN